MQLRYKYRLYPTPSQREALARAFGCARVVFNDGLRLRQEAQENGLPHISDRDLSKQAITHAKTTPERAWLGEVSAVVLQQALEDLHAAFRNFFASASGKRKGRTVAPPRFRSRKDYRQAIRFTKNARFSITAGRKLRLPKIGDVPVRWSRDLPSKPSSVTVIKDASGRYFASFVVEATNEPLPHSPNEVGIDLGLASFAVLSDGKVIDNPRLLRRAERRLRKAQRALSRKAECSNNRAKARIKVAKAHAKVTDARRDFAHKTSTQIIRENQAVYVEDLCVSGLARTRLAKSVHDAGWSQFTAMLDYKSARYGRHFGRIGRFEPTSQVCSACGVKDGPKPLRVRSWVCSRCATIHDRDLNAAKNILAAGRADRLNACGGTVRPGSGLARPGEAGTHSEHALVGVAGENPPPSGRGGRQAAAVIAILEDQPMAKQPTPQGISALLRKAGHKRSEKSQSRIKGMTEHSAGYEVRKYGSDAVEVRYQPGLNRNTTWTEEKLAAFAEAIEAGGFRVRRDAAGSVSVLIVSANEED